MKFGLLKPSVSAKDLYIQGLNLLLEGNREEAIRQLTECVRIDSEIADAYLLLGTLFRERGEWERAEKIHAELLLRPSLAPEIKAKIKLSLIRDYLAGRKFKRAEQLILEAMESNRQLWLKEELLNVYEATENWEKAVALKSDIDRQKGTDDPGRLALYHLENGRALMEKNGRAARIEFKEAIKINPQLPWPYIFIADSYFKEEREEDALEYWSKLMDTVPERSHLLFEKMEKYYFDSGEYGEVGRIYQEIIHRLPNNVEALLALSRYLFKRGDREEAVVYCKKALSIDPQSRIACATLVSHRLHMSKGCDDLKGAAEALLQFFPQRKKYRCSGCGVKTEVLLWRCGSCRSWNPHAL